MTLTSTGTIPGFGKVWLPDAPTRVSSKRYHIPLRAQLKDGDSITVVVAACDEHPSVVNVNSTDRGNNRTLTVEVNTARVRDTRLFTYQVVDDIMRSIQRKAQVLTSVSDAKPGTVRRPAAGRARR